MKHVIVATDLSESSVAALRYAWLLAAHFRGRVTVVHAGRSRAEIEEHVAPLLEGVPHVVEFVDGPPAEVIVDAQRRTGADLIVMGTHGHRGWRRAALGSVAENVLHLATCPVLTVNRHTTLPANGPVTISRVLCPTNFSDVARESLAVATMFAEAFNAELDVVHVVENGTPPLLLDKGPYRQIVLRGGAAERILDYAEDIGADLLVIGAQRQWFRDETVIGTTTERLVRFASCPVLAVTRPAAARKPAEERELATPAF